MGKHGILTDGGCPAELMQCLFDMSLKDAAVVTKVPISNLRRIVKTELRCQWPWCEIRDGASP